MVEIDVPAVSECPGVWAVGWRSVVVRPFYSLFVRWIGSGPCVGDSPIARAVIHRRRLHRFPRGDSGYSRFSSCPPSRRTIVR